jgi:predicted HNH restriction endonuclease
MRQITSNRSAQICTDDYGHTKGQLWQLLTPLRVRDLERPISENYRQGWYFYGIYEREFSNKSGERLVARRGAGFFGSVLEQLPGAPSRTEASGTYPRSENRRRVISHLTRERSPLLVEDCKIRDGYRCQVCRIRFEDVYGTLGRDFAEAHHIVPLSQLKGEVKSTVDDLITVCANCHRMLHKMDGKRDDVPKLRKIVNQRK